MDNASGTQSNSKMNPSYIHRKPKPLTHVPEGTSANIHQKLMLVSNFPPQATAQCQPATIHGHLRFSLATTIILTSYFR
jgi:hypothetical protein